MPVQKNGTSGGASPGGRGRARHRTLVKSPGGTAERDCAAPARRSSGGRRSAPGRRFPAALSAPLGVFIVWSAAALFLVETMAARQAKSFLLDSIDQQIEQENMAASLIEQKPLRETHGFTVMGAEILNQDSRTKLASAATRLDPELQDLLGAQKA